MCDFPIRFCFVKLHKFMSGQLSTFDCESPAN